MTSIKPGSPGEARFDLSRRARLRVALVSDTHGVLDDRIADIVAGCDLAVHAGDIGDAGVLERLQVNGTRAIAVRGNNDTPHQWPAAQRRVLEGLPERGLVALPGGLLVVLHGHHFHPVAERHGKLRTTFADARLIVYGHSHRQVCDRSARPWVVNPGVAGHARTFGGPACAVLSATARRWTVREHRFPLP